MHTDELIVTNGITLLEGEEICPDCNGKKCHITGHCFNAAICNTCYGYGKVESSTGKLTPSSISTDTYKSFIDVY